MSNRSHNNIIGRFATISIGQRRRSNIHNLSIIHSYFHIVLEMFDLLVHQVSNPEQPNYDHDHVKDIESMPQIQEIFLGCRITKSIDKEQSNFDPNKQQILRNLEHNAENTIVVHPHGHHISNFDDVHADQNNRSYNLMFRKHADKKSHNKVPNEADENVVVVFDFVVAYCLHLLVVNVLVLVHEICGVLYGVKPVSVADHEEGPCNGDDEGDEAQGQVESLPGSIILEDMELHEGRPHGSDKLIPPNLVKIVQGPGRNVTEEAHTVRRRCLELIDPFVTDKHDDEPAQVDQVYDDSRVERTLKQDVLVVLLEHLGRRVLVVSEPLPLDALGMRVCEIVQVLHSLEPNKRSLIGCRQLRRRYIDMQEQQLQQNGELLENNSNSKEGTHDHGNKSEPLEKIIEPIDLIGRNQVILGQLTKTMNELLSLQDIQWAVYKESSAGGETIVIDSEYSGIRACSDFQGTIFETVVKGDVVLEPIVKVQLIFELNSIQFEIRKLVDLKFESVLQIGIIGYLDIFVKINPHIKTRTDCIVIGIAWQIFYLIVKLILSTGGTVAQVHLQLPDIDPTTLATNLDAKCLTLVFWGIVRVCMDHLVQVRSANAGAWGHALSTSFVQQFHFLIYAILHFYVNILGSSCAICVRQYLDIRFVDIKDHVETSMGWQIFLIPSNCHHIAVIGASYSPQFLIICRARCLDQWCVCSPGFFIHNPIGHIRPIERQTTRWRRYASSTGEPIGDPASLAQFPSHHILKLPVFYTGCTIDRQEDKLRAMGIQASVTSFRNGFSWVIFGIVKALDTCSIIADRVKVKQFETFRALVHFGTHALLTA